MLPPLRRLPWCTHFHPQCIIRCLFFCSLSTPNYPLLLTYISSINIFYFWIVHVGEDTYLRSYWRNEAHHSSYYDILSGGTKWQSSYSRADFLRVTCRVVTPSPSVLTPTGDHSSSLSPWGEYIFQPHCLGLGHMECGQQCGWVGS